MTSQDLYLPFPAEIIHNVLAQLIESWTIDLSHIANRNTKTLVSFPYPLQTLRLVSRNFNSTLKHLLRRRFNNMVYLTSENLHLLDILPIWLRDCVKELRVADLAGYDVTPMPTDSYILSLTGLERICLGVHDDSNPCGIKRNILDGAHDAELLAEMADCVDLCTDEDWLGFAEACGGNAEDGHSGRNVQCLSTIIFSQDDNEEIDVDVGLRIKCCEVQKATIVKRWRRVPVLDPPPACDEGTSRQVTRLVEYVL